MKPSSWRRDLVKLKSPRHHYESFVVAAWWLLLRMPETMGDALQCLDIVKCRASFILCRMMLSVVIETVQRIDLQKTLFGRQDCS